MYASTLLPVPSPPYDGALVRVPVGVTQPAQRTRGWSGWRSRRARDNHRTMPAWYVGNASALCWRSEIPSADRMRSCSMETAKQTAATQSRRMRAEKQKCLIVYGYETRRVFHQNNTITIFFNTLNTYCVLTILIGNYWI